MRTILMGAAVLSLAGAAQAQNSGWGTFAEGTGFGVGLNGADGAMLLLRCDKPGPNSVYAVIATKEFLVPPAPTWVMRPAQLRFDDRAPYEDRLRFYEHHAIAINDGNERSMRRFMTDLGTAKTVEVRLVPDTRRRTETVTVKFNLDGSAPAIEHVYTSCQDQVPA